MAQMVVEKFPHHNYYKSNSLELYPELISQKFGKDTIRFSVERNREQWEMKRELMSPRYTTRIEEVIKIY